MSATKTLLEVLRRHYIKPSADWPGGIFIPECGINGPGPQSRADALYVGFTSTSGRLLVGHEIKVSRADWRKELDTVGKADFWADACHEWWIVAPGPEIVPVEEVPNGWGLLYPGRQMRMKVAKKAATKTADHAPRWDAVRSIMARLDTLQTQAMQEHLRGERDRIHKEVSRLREAERERAGKADLDPGTRDRLLALDHVERQLGVSLADSWQEGDGEIAPDTLVACLRLAQAIRTSGVEEIRTSRYQGESLARQAQTLLDGLAEFDAARTALLALIRPEGAST